MYEMLRIKYQMVSVNRLYGDGDDDDDDGDAFVYDGKDAEPAGTYRDQLREVLEEDMGSYDEYLEEAEVDKSLQVVSGSVIGSDVGQVKCTFVTHHRH